MVVGDIGSAQLFWSVFLFYIITFIISTVLKSYLTARGLFPLLTFATGSLLGVTFFNIHTFTTYQNSTSVSFLFTKGSWFLMEWGINLHVDGLGFFFILLVLIIGFCTNIYILNYFKFEANEDSFIILINAFIISMLVLVMANNFFTLFLGWELIGLASFFLINFWSERAGTLKASFKAFTFNKISDFFLLVALLIMWGAYGTSNIKMLNAFWSVGFINDKSQLYVAAVFIILCACVKSAQLIGHLWLPDSMEAPVPASALIHSATLVSAGVYLLLRFTPLLQALNLLHYVVFIGACTAAYGGIVAAAQTDMKKLLAYSTISHCGFLFVAVGLGNHYLVLIYLFMHGIFKAMAFFTAGSFIRVASSQDTRQMGIMSRYLPGDTICLIIAAINLGGLPLTFGYLYKSFFLNVLVQSSVSTLVVALCFVGMLSSIVYVYRLVYYSCFDYQKHSLHLLVKELQDSTQLEKKNWSFSSYVGLLAPSVMFLISIYMFLHFKTQSTTGIHLDLSPIQLVADGSLHVTAGSLYSFYINLFYVLYVSVILTLVLFEGRKTYTWEKTINLLILLASLIIFFVIIYN